MFALLVKNVEYNGTNMMVFLAVTVPEQVLLYTVLRLKFPSSICPWGFCSSLSNNYSSLHYRAIVDNEQRFRKTK